MAEIGYIRANLDTSWHLKCISGRRAITIYLNNKPLMLFFRVIQQEIIDISMMIIYNYIMLLSDI